MWTEKEELTLLLIPGGGGGTGKGNSVLSDAPFDLSRALRRGNDLAATDLTSFSFKLSITDRTAKAKSGKRSVRKTNRINIPKIDGTRSQIPVDP